MPNFRWHLGAAALYAAAAWLFIDHGLPLGRVILGYGADPTAYMWFLAWLPYALQHHLNPLYTTLIWQPDGLNLAWTASIPFLALVAAPVTLIAGPLLAYDLLAIAAPFTAALGAYALCLYVTRKPPAAMLGGYIYGFSSYELAQSIGHLNLTFTVFVPLLLLVVLARLDNRLRRLLAVISAAVVLACQFGVSVEVFATEIMFGGIAWVLAYGAFPARRAVLARLMREGVAAAVLLAVPLAPYLWVMFTLPDSFSPLPASWPRFFSTDLLNLVVPTFTTKFGGHLAIPMTSHFTGFPAEQDGYLGFLLLAIVLLFCRRHNWFFGALFGAIVLLSLGPQLWVGGIATGLPLPWALGEHLPFIKSALPSRFMLYAWLLAAVIAALWVADPRPGQNRRMVIARLACLLLLPVLFPGQPDPALPFFRPGTLQGALGPHPRRLIVPFGISGNSSFWQAENDFGFAQTGGYLGEPPASVAHDSPIQQLFGGLAAPGLAPDLAAYCRRTGTQFIVATPDAPADVVAAVRSLGWPARQIAGVTVFTVMQN